MARSIEVPVSLLRKVARAADAFTELEEELEDYLLSQDPKLIERMRYAKIAHHEGRVRSLVDVKQDLFIE